MADELDFGSSTTSDRSSTDFTPKTSVDIDTITNGNVNDAALCRNSGPAHVACTAFRRQHPVQLDVVMFQPQGGNNTISSDVNTSRNYAFRCVLELDGHAAPTATRHTGSGLQRGVSPAMPLGGGVVVNMEDLT